MLLTQITQGMTPESRFILQNEILFCRLCGHTLIFEFIEVHFSLYLMLSAYFSSLLLTVLFMIIFDSRAFALRKETWFNVYQNQSRVTSS